MFINLHTGYEAGFKTIDGNFESGMTLDQAKKKGDKKLLFDFKGIDKDNNTRLSRQEIIDRRNQEIKKLKADLKKYTQNLIEKETSLKGKEISAEDQIFLDLQKAKIEELTLRIQQEEYITEAYVAELKEAKSFDPNQFDGFSK